MSQTCSYYLTQRGHIDEQLKERLKSQKEENRTCLLKIVQSISYLYRQGIALCKSKQERRQISNRSSFSKLKTLKCFESGLKSVMTSHMSLNAKNKILNRGSKSAMRCSK